MAIYVYSRYILLPLAAEGQPDLQTSLCAEILNEMQISQQICLLVQSEPLPLLTLIFLLMELFIPAKVEVFVKGDVEA